MILLSPSAPASASPAPGAAAPSEPTLVFTILRASTPYAWVM